MIVRDVMTTPALTVRRDTLLKAAIVLLDEHGITMLPVTDASGAVVGTLSEADVVRDLVSPDAGGPPAFRRDIDHGVQARRCVADLMDTSPLTVSATSDLTTATRLMADAAAKSLPVVDDESRVVGVVSRRDIVRVLARTDDAIKRDFRDLFRRIGDDWTVDVHDGVVTLSGPILPAELRVAEMAAMAIVGVHSVTVVPD